MTLQRDRLRCRVLTDHQDLWCVAANRPASRSMPVHNADIADLKDVFQEAEAYLKELEGTK